MPQVLFLNPNEPGQPVSGVYRWFARKNENEIFTLYIGNAGERRILGARRPSTLGRGVSELQKSSVSSNGGVSLDTDFIVGTAIQFICEEIKVDCCWEHICNDPNSELASCIEYRPVLQTIDFNDQLHHFCRNINQEFKLIGDIGRWGRDNWGDARDLLYNIFRQRFHW